jgi:hypothetical protein
MGRNQRSWKPQRVGTQMAKKKFVNLNDQMAAAKTVAKKFAVLQRDYERSHASSRRILLQLKRKPVSRRTKQDLRNLHDKQITYADACTRLRKLIQRRTRYEEVQADKRVPATLRKEIHDQEGSVFRFEFSSWFGGSGVAEQRRELAGLYEQARKSLLPKRKCKTSHPMFRKGKSCKRISLTKAFDGHVFEVMESHFVIVLEKGRLPFRIIESLPTKEEYLKIRDEFFTHTLEYHVASAYSEIETLADELNDAYESMPDGLKDGELGERRAETSRELMEITDEVPMVPEVFASVELLHIPSTKVSSRGDRAKEAASRMEAVAKKLSEIVQNTKIRKSVAATVEEVLDQLTDHASAVRDVEFPGMYG